MRPIVAGLVLLLTLGASADGCEETQRLAACEKAFRKEYRRVLDADEYDAGRLPAKCRGIPKRELKRIAVRVIRDETPRLPTSGKDS